MFVPNSDHSNGSSIPLPITDTNSSTRSSEASPDAAGAAPGKWAAKLLRECAAAMSEKNSGKIHHLMWTLNELSSPYGDCDQKLAAYFLQALFCRATDSGHRCHRTLVAAAEKSHSFDSLRRLILKFQEVSPWTTFGHVASNGAVLEALDGAPAIHIIDISHTLCTQWPTLLETLAMRADETPRLRLTAVAATAAAKAAMKEIAPRMEKFARLMGVPFEFNVLAGLAHLGQLTKEVLAVHDGEAVAVNCVGALRRVDVGERENFIRMIKTLTPKVVTVVEEEADFAGDDFPKCFEECLRFNSAYFDMLEDSFGTTSNEKLMLERECSRSIVRVLACTDDLDGDGDCERRERAIQWSERLRGSGFSTVGFSDDVVDDVKALLKRYRDGWSLVKPGDDDDGIGGDRSAAPPPGIFLAWKDEPVVWASVWKP
ncbi:protein SHORT-ROOT-like [Andrographis paniculata]|uniref:protein SHORT-ROOT-like n=1 Tax=Andrographis paniculata TaxID=175694 RepID=UPI0021E8B9DD|nr:protein SHORT-ROOT-like [Andrographis paniculata]